LGNNTFSRDPLSIVTRDSDHEWSDIIDSVIQILYTAEAMNITQANVHTTDFDQFQIHEELANRIIQVVSTVGNYDELYQSEAHEIVSRRGMNTLNQHLDTGLMYSYPVGQTNQIARSGTLPFSATLEEIKTRMYLRCGITRRPGFAEYDDSATNNYFGMDVEYCKLLSAALFVGNVSKVEFIELNETTRFQALRDGRVDVLAGQQVSLTNQFFEPTTGLSYSFSAPYFYDNTDILALATRREDELWSSFVYWMTTSVVYAEEQNITKSTAIQMPTVTVFGDSFMQAFQQSFRDCVAGVGNYGELYARTLQSLLPREGGNLLNTAPFGPQQAAFPLV
jgi:hypothetical protein